MATLGYRVGILEIQVDQLVTWAGPGQAEALSASLHETRAEMVKMRRLQEAMRRTHDRHTQQLGNLASDVAGLKGDVAGLKTDMAEVKGAVQEILRRLPAA
jgi:chromosome segregation ATPase